MTKLALDKHAADDVADSDKAHNPLLSVEPRHRHSGAARRRERAMDRLDQPYAIPVGIGAEFGNRDRGGSRRVLAVPGAVDHENGVAPWVPPA